MLVLALALVLALNVSLMLAGGKDAAALARATVFATLMIILNGILGICLPVGGIRPREQTFSLDGVSAAFVALGTITINDSGVTEPHHHQSRTLLLAQPVAAHCDRLPGDLWHLRRHPTVGHRDFFLDTDADAGPDAQAPLATAPRVCLTCVVVLAKKLAPSLESAVQHFGAPNVRVGVTIAATYCSRRDCRPARGARQPAADHR